MKAELSHVAFLVPSVTRSATYLSSKGFACDAVETFESEGTHEVYVGEYQTQSGLLLLVEAVGDGPYKRAMIKRGPSLHHIAIDVLDSKEFIAQLQKVGWQLHPVDYGKTVWLFCKGLPLLEVNEKNALSTKPAKISQIQFPIHLNAMPAFEGLMNSKFSQGDELSLVADGVRLNFAEIACLENSNSD